VNRASGFEARLPGVRQAERGPCQHWRRGQRQLIATDDDEPRTQAGMTDVVGGGATRRTQVRRAVADSVTNGRELNVDIES
jgi:hypothetical protein